MLQSTKTVRRISAIRVFSRSTVVVVILLTEASDVLHQIVQCLLVAAVTGRIGRTVGPGRTTALGFRVVAGIGIFNASSGPTVFVAVSLVDVLHQIVLVRFGCTFRGRSSGRTTALGFRSVAGIGTFTSGSSVVVAAVLLAEAFDVVHEILQRLPIAAATERRRTLGAGSGRATAFALGGIVFRSLSFQFLHGRHQLLQQEVGQLQGNLEQNVHI